MYLEKDGFDTSIAYDGEQAIELVGRAEAEAIRAKSEAMKANPDYVRMLQAEKWDGRLPQSIVPSSSVPILKLQ